MLPIIAAVIATVSLDGSIAADHQGDYVLVPFEVPAGTVEIHVSHRSVAGTNVLDWGVWSPDGFRGWGGGLEDDAIIGIDDSSRGYLPGAITEGTWHLVIGKASISSSPADYEASATFHDAATLTPRFRAPFGPTVVASSPNWFRGDFHVHSRESGDAPASLDEIVQLGRQRGLDFVALTDHNTTSQHGLIAGLQEELDDILLMRGAEVTTYAGHANAFGFADYVDHRIGLDDRTAAAMIGDVVAQGGLVSINHPALDLGSACIGCAWSHADTPWEQVSAIEIHTGAYEATIGLFTPRAIALWDEQIDAGHRLAAIAGSDDHRAGQGTGVNDSPIGSPTTVVYAERLSEEAILDGVRQGRTVVLLRGPDDPFVELFIEAGGERGMLGDTVVGSRAVIEAHVTGGNGLDLSLVRNGVPGEIVTLEGDDVTHRFEIDIAETGDRFRVEVLDNFLPVTITSHVYAEYAPEPEGGCCDAGGGAGGSVLLALLVLLGLRSRRGLQASIVPAGSTADA